MFYKLCWYLILIFEQSQTIFNLFLLFLVQRCKKSLKITTVCPYLSHGAKIIRSFEILKLFEPVFTRALHKTCAHDYQSRRHTFQKSGIQLITKSGFCSRRFG